MGKLITAAVVTVARHEWWVANLSESQQIVFTVPTFLVLLVNTAGVLWGASVE